MQASTLPSVDTLALELQHGVLYMTLNRPESRNAMSLQMTLDVALVFEAIADNADIRAVVIRGKDGHFCAGGDIKDMSTACQKAAESGDPTAYKDLNRAFGRMVDIVDHAPQVTITLLEGAVLGGGFGLACVSDVAIAMDTAQFGLPETGLGVIPAQIAPFVVQRVGLTQARYLALLGARFKAPEALARGVIHHVVQSEDELQTLLAQVLTQIKRCAPNANRVTKSLLHRVGHEPLGGLLDDAASLFAQAVASDEGFEGTMAFVQKRLPRWAE